MHLQRVPQAQPPQALVVIGVTTALLYVRQKRRQQRPEHQYPAFELTHEAILAPVQVRALTYICCVVCVLLLLLLYVCMHVCILCVCSYVCMLCVCSYACMLCVYVVYSVRMYMCMYVPCSSSLVLV